MVLTCDHVSESETYGGRNTSERIANDAADPTAAAESNLSRYTDKWISHGLTSDQIEQIERELNTLNAALGRYSG